MEVSERHDLMDGLGVRPDEAAAGASPAPGDARLGDAPLDEPNRRRTLLREASRTRLTAGLVAWDALVPVALLALTARFSGGFGEEINGGSASATDGLALVLAVASPLSLAIAGAYDHRRRRAAGRVTFAIRLLLVGLVLSWMSLMLSSAAGWPIDFAQMFAMSVLLPVGWMVGRWACDHHPATGAERVLVVGGGPIAGRVAEHAARHPERHLELLGRLDDGPETEDDPLHRLGGVSALEAIVDREPVDRIIVTSPPDRDTELHEVLRGCVARGIQVDVLPRFHDLVGPAPRAQSLGRLALMEIPGRGLTPGQRTAKRITDAIGAGVLLVCLSPVFAATAAMILVRDRRPIFFRQARQGQGGKVFQILKFRTMRPGSEPDVLADGTTDAGALIDGHKASARAAVTANGALLRRTSIDELPQLWNVLKGDMSLVGPRPLPLYESDHLAGWHFARQDLKPGVTGLWQVSGRSDVDWEERMQMDYTYVSHWSLGNDMRILLRTIPAVLRKDGAV